MRILLSFSSEEIYRLFLTYLRKPSNYKKIKEKVIGEGARSQFRKDLKGSFYFIIALTIVVSISSLYPLTLGDYMTIASIWFIWFLLLIPFLGFMIFLYRTSYDIMQQNENFFKRFEAKAENCKTLQDFRSVWEQKTSE